MDNKMNFIGEKRMKKAVILFALTLIMDCSSVPDKQEAKVEENKISERTLDQSKKSDNLAWFKDKSPVYISISLLKIKASEEFCNRFEPGLFGSSLGGLLRKPDLDFRAWLREENSNIAHIASTQGFEIITLKCGKEENTKFSFFQGNGIISRDSHLSFSIKIYENDQLVTDNKTEKLNKIVTDLLSIATAAVDKGFLQKNRGDAFLNYFSFALIPVDLLNNINNLIYGEETLVTSFEINLFRDNYFLPATTSGDTIKTEILKANEIKNFTVLDNSKLPDMKDVTAIRYEIPTKANELELTFEILLSKRKD